MEIFRIYFRLIIVVLFHLKFIQIEGKIGSERPLDLVKRHLRWNSNGYIVSDKSSTKNYKVDFLQSHERNVAVESDRDFMAFNLYMVNGLAVAANTGIFHFIDSKIANEKRSNCERSTMHAGAYYYFYGRCPEDDTNVVASGYCYQGKNKRGLVYNSYTFNDVSMTYVDKSYYLNDDKAIHSIEQNLIRSCFNSWKNDGFPKKWKCSTRDIPITSRLSLDSEKTVSDRSSGVCSECECTRVNGSSGIYRLNLMSVFISLLGVLIRMF